MRLIKANDGFVFQARSFFLQQRRFFMSVIEITQHRRKYAKSENSWVYIDRTFGSDCDNCGFVPLQFGGGRVLASSASLAGGGSPDPPGGL